jgi:hypothetical protein
MLPTVAPGPHLRLYRPCFSNMNQGTIGAAGRIPGLPNGFALVKRTSSERAVTPASRQPVRRLFHIGKQRAPWIAD